MQIFHLLYTPNNQGYFITQHCGDGAEPETYLDLAAHLQELSKKKHGWKIFITPKCKGLISPRIIPLNTVI